MKLHLVERPNGNVVVTILRNKSDYTYSYVNLTKGHICPCRFVSEEEALHDGKSCANLSPTQSLGVREPVKA